MTKKEIQMPNEWIEIEPVSGRDSGQIIIRYGKNDTSSGRSATVRIWNSDFKITATTVITQSICPTEITGITLNASWLNDVPASGGTATKDNCSYNVMGLLDDGSTRNVTDLSNVYGSLTVPASTDVNRHSVGTLTLNAKYQDFTDSENVIAYQAGYEIPTGTTDGCDVEVVYNVTSTTRPTKLYNLLYDASRGIDYFTIDDDPTQHELTNTGYTFDTTGNHTVHYYMTGDTLNSGCFSSCYSLSSATIGTRVTSLGDSCFWNCYSLSAITIPDSVTTLGHSCFGGCDSLSSITIPDSVTSLGDYCFQSSSLSSITIGTGVTSLSYNCFNGCVSLSSITIPDSVTTLGDSCFNGCRSLSSITIPDSVTSLGDGCFYSCYSLSSITIGTGVTSLSDSCFRSCTGLTSIDIPDSVTSLVRSCFHNCYSLSSATIGTGVTSIGINAFYYCTGLTSIDIPDSVTSLGFECFFGCTGLSSITCLPTVPPTSGSNMFNNTNNCPIYVPDDSVDTYKSSWTEYSNRIYPISQKPSENEINVSSNIEWDTNISEQ